MWFQKEMVKLEFDLHAYFFQFCRNPAYFNFKVINWKLQNNYWIYAIVCGTAAQECAACGGWLRCFLFINGFLVGLTEMQRRKDDKMQGLRSLSSCVCLRGA